MTNDETVAVPAPADAPSVRQPSDLRAQLLEEFERWVDQMLADEPAPPGVPERLLAEAADIATAEPSPPETDLYTLFSALTALTGEIRLQGRAFKQLTDLLSPLSESPARLSELRAAQAESAQMLLALAARLDDRSHVPFSRVCEVLIDMYDRLQRGLRTCDEGIETMQARRPKGWARRLFTSSDRAAGAISSVQALRDSNELALARLAGALQEWGVQRIGTIGEPFDAGRMAAVDVREADDVPPDTVMAVHRSGYAVNGVIRSAAQVTVSKRNS